MFFWNCFSVVGHSEPQHTGDGHNGCAFPACQPRILVHQKPGKFLPACYLWSVRHYSHMSCFGMFFQGRQKLARFSAHEFATLVIDILTDAKRRQWGNSCESPKGNVSQFFSFWDTLTFLFLLNIVLNIVPVICIKHDDWESTVQEFWIAKKVQPKCSRPV